MSIDVRSELSPYNAALIRRNGYGLYAVSCQVFLRNSHQEKALAQVLWVPWVNGAIFGMRYPDEEELARLKPACLGYQTNFLQPAVALR